jgi:hypothetical protein
MLMNHSSDDIFRATGRKLDVAGIRCVSYYSASVKSKQDLEDRGRLAAGPSKRCGVPYPLHDSRVIDELSSRQLESPTWLEEMMPQARCRAAVRPIPTRSVLSMSHSRTAANWFGRHLSD